MNGKILNQLSKTHFQIKTFHICFKLKLVIFMSSKKEKNKSNFVARNKICATSQTFSYPNNSRSLLCAAETRNLCSHSFQHFTFYIINTVIFWSNLDFKVSMSLLGLFMFTWVNY